MTIAQNGIGYSTHTAVDRPVTKNDQQAGRYLIVRDNDSGEFWSVTWYPVTADLDRFQVTHRLGSTEVSTEKNKIATQVIFNVNATEPCEQWQVQLMNNDTKKRRLSVFAFVEWEEDMQESQFHDNAIITTSAHAPDKLFARIFTLDHAVDSFDCDWQHFIGRYSTLSRPKAVVDGKCSRSIGSDNRVAVLQKNITIGAGSESKATVLLGAAIVENLAQAKRLAKKLGKLGGQSAQQLPDRIMVKSPNHELNLLTNYWSKLQSLSPISDYTDSLKRLTEQLSLTTHQPERVKRELVATLSQQYRDGSLLRSITEPLPDQTASTLSQLITTLCRYLNESGDTEALSEHLPFFDSGSASILEHLIRSSNATLDQLKAEETTLVDRARIVTALKQVAPILMHAGEHQLIRRIERIIEDQAIRITRQWSKSTTRELETTIQLLSAQVLPQKAQKSAIAHLISELKQIGGTGNELLLSTLISGAQQLAQNDEAEYSIELLEQYLPTTRSKSADLYQAEPYLFPRSIMADPQRRGQASTDLDREAAAQFSTLITETILGVQPTVGGLKIDPHIPRSWRQFEVSREFRGATYHIRVSNPLRATSGVSRLSVNGLHLTGHVIRPFKTGHHFIEVTLG